MGESELAIFGPSMGDTIEKVLTASVIFLLFNAIVHMVYMFLHKMLQMDLLWAQMIRTLLQIIIAVVSLIVILGKETVLRLVAGFSIGFGYAFQPVLLGAMNAVYLRSEDKFIGSTIKVAGVTGRVLEAGLFHMKLQEEKTNNTVYISNLKLTENISILGKTTKFARPLESSSIPEMYRRS